MIHGIDVSDSQADIDWAAVKETGEVQFAFAKATEGLHLDMDTYADNRNDCALRHIPFGAYHFFHPSEDPIAQARHFITVAKPKVGDLFPMVDVETSDNCEPGTIITQLATFNKYVEDILKAKVIIYTGYEFWNDVMRGSDAFSGHPLWIAEYNSDDAPTLPKGWTEWALWQYSSTGKIAGINGDVDLDVMHLPMQNLTL